MRQSLNQHATTMAAVDYRGSRIALATRHGKQRVIGRAIRHGLGAALLHLPELDTDALGSFCGSVPRSGSALDACIAKAELALAHTDTPLAIASEGSFGPHPAVPLLPVGVECMVFLDRQRGLTIREELIARRTNFSQRLLGREDLATGAPSADLERWLQASGFPSHALIVRPLDGPAKAAIQKGLQDPKALVQTLSEALAQAGDRGVQLETDMRAHCNPTRMASIRQLSFRLVRRIASGCPACHSPGWGLIERLPGLPCGWCGLPTERIAQEVFGCVACDHRQVQHRADGLQAADPEHCPHCNP